MLAAAVMMSVGIDAQAAPLARRTEPAIAPKTATPTVITPSTQAQPAQPRRVVVRRPKQKRLIDRAATNRAATNRPATDRAGADRAGADRADTDLGERLNTNTLVIVADGPGSTDLAITYQLAAVLGDGDAMRILPTVGVGGGRNIRDVRFMKGIDLAITQTNVLARMRQNGEIGALDDKIVYLAKLFNEELHIVVRADSGIGSIEQLSGRSVSLGEPGSGTQAIAHDVLERLGIAVREVDTAGTDPIARLAAGEIDAVALIGGKPIPAVAQRSGLRLLAVPFAKPLREEFLPAALTSDDYPELVESGSRVDTVAVGTVLIAYNWAKDSDQYKKIRRFVAAFFPQIAKLQTPPLHP
jgi:TRAP transporter TAXI family solute receptor